MTYDLVRRAKAPSFIGCKSDPATLLQSVAIGAVVEATKRLKPPESVGGRA